jgi:hypothetical protein
VEEKEVIFILEPVANTFRYMKDIQHHTEGGVLLLLSSVDEKKLSFQVVRGRNKISKIEDS